MRFSYYAERCIGRCSSGMEIVALLRLPSDQRLADLVGAGPERAFEV
jgi:hypothetical protein